MWINCNNEMPTESDGIVLIAFENGNISTGKYSEFSSRWYVGDMCEVCDKLTPVAWQKLPRYP